MSQSIFRVSDEIECLVGWDPPLATFFGQVYMIDKDGERMDETRDGKDATLLWVGTEPSEICTVDDLAAKLSAYAQLPEDVRKELVKFEYD